jgi:acyl carrier protein phosphodiesterase
MNFIGHLYVAQWSSDAPRFLLGAMLPDFASMAGVRLSAIADDELASGVRLHHRTDDVFHSAPMFTALVHDTIATLTARGVERGPARAVGHIGVEMLIDGELLRQAEVGAAYLYALAAFEGVSHALDTTSEAALSALLVRLVRHGIPYDYERPEAVTARVSSVLARRPRLALSAPAQAVVGSIMPDLKARVVVCLPELLAHLSQGPLDPRYSETITG